MVVSIYALRVSVDPQKALSTSSESCPGCSNSLETLRQRPESSTPAECLIQSAQ